MDPQLKDIYNKTQVPLYNYSYLGTRPPNVLVHLKGVSVRSLLSPPLGASTSPRNKLTYSVNATVISSTELLGVPNSSNSLCLVAFNCLL